ncbi:MAG: hypothetical protein BECKG1743D_GA0114223_105771 [Candidatus Kentron sp. G]|nr:MAG: hypothetical protein BECKG1743F_GA0114225_105411 [Candidatus Kentron sp. G]VFN02893.1 MAG: hypothetical protein BECKG1743E_GA0114224_105562 [Candidatus Kentron sp. G]VFN04361.1 MAG: hypothetical protein BECKG1743D_GA0114223_105771 [Candidatus Kentron sp. G]
MSWLPLVIVTGFPVTIQAMYLALCPIVALIGRNKSIGFWGFLFFSILFSPVLGLFVAIVSTERDKK